MCAISDARSKPSAAHVIVQHGGQRLGIVALGREHLVDLAEHLGDVAARTP